MAETPLTEMGEVRLKRPPDPPGQLQTLITVLDSKIIMDHGRAVWWVGFNAEQAQKLGEDLINAARLARTLHVVPTPGY